MHHRDELDKFLVAKLFLNDVLEVEVLLFHIAEDVLVDPELQKGKQIGYDNFYLT